MKKRLISALIALIIIVPILLVGGIYFRILATILGILAIKEILDLKDIKLLLINIITYILIGTLIFFTIDIKIKIIIPIIIYYSLMVFINNDKYNINDCTYLTSFSILTILVFSSFYMLRNQDINILIYLLLITIFTDTFAYAGGRLFGKHKLIERVSPNKTIEGSVIGSLIGTILPTGFYIYMIAPGENIFIILIFTLILSIVGQIGDLIFSSIKRYYKVKDFSNIMPGHGGIFDRLDSIIFVVLGYLLLINLL